MSKKFGFHDSYKKLKTVTFFSNSTHENYHQDYKKIFSYIMHIFSNTTKKTH